MTAAWREHLLFREKKSGPPELRRIAANGVTILANDPAWSDVIAFDAFREAVVKLAPPPWDQIDAPADARLGEWSDEDTARATNWLSRHYDLDLGPLTVDQAVIVAAAGKVVHPIRDWLAGLRWDGTGRLDSLLVSYFGAPDTPYVRGVGARFAIGAVARVYEPGAKVDCVPVLEGAQGIGKSTGIRKLAGASWFFDTPITMGDKDGYQALRGKWIGELAELDSLNRSDMNRAKAFLSATCDSYRPSFARRTKDFQRQVVFVGSTNATEYLRDVTGGRRFWPVRCTRVDLAAIDQDRVQLWAEARTRYERGEAWHVDTAEFAALCAAEQEERFVADAWEAPIHEWVMSAGHPERRRDGVTSGDVLAGALTIAAERWTKPDQDRVAAVLRHIGWERGRQERTGCHRVRRFRPKLVTLVTPPVTAVSSGNHQGSNDVSPVSPAYARPRMRAHADSANENACGGGDSGDAVTSLFAGYLTSEGIGVAQ